jgi:hypothetical protein
MFTWNHWILPTATPLLDQATYNLTLPQPMCHLPFCLLQKLNLTFELQVPFLLSLLVIHPIWLPLPNTFRLLNKRNFVAWLSIMSVLLWMVKWLFEHSMRAIPSLFPSLLTPLVPLVPLQTDSFLAFNRTLNRTHLTSRVLLLNMPTKIPCPLLCLLACHTVQINIGHKICLMHYARRRRKKGCDWCVVKVD